MTDQGESFFFGPFRCAEQERIVYRGDEPVSLPPKAVLTLLVLLRNAPRLLEKDALLEQVWASTFVEEGNLTHNISILRKALGDDRNGNGMIETVPRRGYRFIAPVEQRVAQAIETTGGQPRVPDRPATLAEEIAPREKPVRTLSISRTIGIAMIVIVALVAAAEFWHMRVNGSVLHPLTHGGTRSLTAYQEFLNGRLYYTKHDPESLHKSVAAFERAIELDRGYAAAYGGLAEAYLVLGQYESSEVAYERMRAAATTALDLDPNLPQAHAVLAFGESMLRWNWSEGERGFRHSIAADPNYAQAHIWFGIMLLRQGRMAEALREAQAALAAEPFHEVVPWLFASIYYNNRQYNQALEWVHKAETAGTQFGSLPLLGAQILSQQHNCPGALAYLEKVKPDTRELIGPYGYVLARCGRSAEALALERRLRATTGVDGATTSYFVAMIDVGLGRSPDAVTNLETAYLGRSGYLSRIKTDPAFVRLHHDARFRRLVHDIGLGQPYD